KFDAIKFNCWDMCRAHIIIYEALMEDSTDQIFGFTHVGDGSGSTTAHVTSWNPIDFARLLKWGETGTQYSNNAMGEISMVVITTLDELLHRSSSTTKNRQFTLASATERNN
ncbi:jg22157, partial [Pararge aegeria aegeria]